MAYGITVGDLRSYIGVDSTDDDELLIDALADAIAFVEAQTNRVFEAVSGTRYYDSDTQDEDTLYLDDDLVSVTTLTNGDSSSTVIPSTEYRLVPRNDTPHYAIRLKSTSSYAWEFDDDNEVAVTGLWGYSTSPPSDIQRAVKRLAAWFYRQQTSTGQGDRTIITPDGGKILPSAIPADVREVIARYRKLI